ncbi:polymer-forming cytoskeletal protein [Paenibacillus sp. DR312]|uniref:polymer-forming cytoskeletal protein n=1 Tax=unclassified Paenibacillus TaxID=185978 RepID=UPI001C9872B5|nr:polymer-forming cytoskeletal protein [Paenibacillus sp. DR312]QZN77380.1 polymer-forming cytoskeletal protein [Paenibacillus sp. DR312]
MFPISPLYKDYLRRPDREFIVKALVGSEEYDSSRIVDFSIENSLSLTEGFEIGTSIPSKLTIKLRTNEIIPANARIVPYLSLSLAGLTWLEAQYPWKDMNLTWTGSGTDWLPLGEFFVDGREKINDVWTFTCYDKLVFADVAYISSLTYPTTQRAVFNEICNRLGWTYDSSVVINSNYRIQAGPAGYTMRQVLAYIASANSASIYIDKAGTLKFKRFTASENPVFDMTTADYVTVKQTNPVKTYTRVVVTYNTEDGLQYEAGTGDENHTLYVENPFATQAVTNGLLTTLNGFSYLPLTMDARGYPQLEQGDVIGFEQQEGTTWDETVSTWQDTNIPWDGVVRYKTIILHQVFTFAGGLKMSLEAPSVSEQRSEFVVEGSLTQQVNKLNKDAVKEGKSYYGTTITRTTGWIVEREDHLSKAVFNSDELTFYAQSDKAIWFDVPSRRYKFNGTLEATDGVFSGNLQAAGGTFTGDLRAAGGTFTGTLQGVNGTFSGTLQAASGTFVGTLKAGRVEGGDIIGSYIQGADILGSRIRTAASGDRIELVPDGFTFYDSGNARRVTLGTNPSANISGHTYYNASGQSQGLIYANSNELAVIGNNGLRLGSTSGFTTLQGSVNFTGSVTGLSLSISQINGLPGQLQSLQNQIDSLRTSFNNHTHTVTTANHNHGNNANLPGTGGGTFTTSTP